jgi:hypothetical protein
VTGDNNRISWQQRLSSGGVSLIVLALGVLIAALIGIGIGTLLTDRSPRGESAADNATQPDQGSSGHSEHNAQGHSEHSQSVSAGDQTTSVALDACRRASERQARAALAADRTLDQWRLHIQAMNRLVAGRITLDQANRYWERTRIGAHRHAAAFMSRYAASRPLEQRCLTRVDGMPAAQVGPSLTTCTQAVRAFGTALSSARVTTATWVHHIDDMDAMRAGKITPAQATSMWVHKWHLGARQLQTYDHALRSALPTRCP